MYPVSEAFLLAVLENTRGSAEIELGTVYVTELGVTLFCRLTGIRWTEREWSFSAIVGWRVEAVRKCRRVFEVSGANRTAYCLELKACDYMLQFEKSFNGVESVGVK